MSDRIGGVRLLGRNRENVYVIYVSGFVGMQSVQKSLYYPIVLAHEKN